jgi:hypothetical protein
MVQWCDMVRALIISLLLAIFSLCLGCSGRRVLYKLPRLQPDETQQVAMTSTTAKYTVAVRYRGDARPRILPETALYVDSGKLIGFTLDERSHVIAFAKRHQYDLGPFPANAKYICWTRAHYRESALEPVVCAVGEVLVTTVVEMAAEATVDAVLDGRTNSNQPRASKLEKKRKRK